MERLQDDLLFGDERPRKPEKKKKQTKGKSELPAPALKLIDRYNGEEPS